VGDRLQHPLGVAAKAALHQAILSIVTYGHCAVKFAPVQALLVNVSKKIRGSDGGSRRLDGKHDVAQGCLEYDLDGRWRGRRSSWLRQRATGRRLVGLLRQSDTEPEAHTDQ
jgi:hypothetical protein